jgi:hypothetical protein
MMDRRTLGRRGALSGGLAVVLVAAPGVSSGEGTAHAAPAYQDQDVARGDADHSPFLAAFLDWLRTESGRLVLPASVDTAVPSCSELRVQGVHPAVQILFPQNCEIAVNVEWEGMDWDQLVWLDAYEKPGPDNSGWINTAMRPEFQVVHRTREALWRADVFEPLLTWINEDLAHATHLAMWEIADGVTTARLVRDGRVLRSRWFIETNGGTPMHLLPVHGYQA